jgi:hypothetical protein
MRSLLFILQASVAQPPSLDGLKFDLRDARSQHSDDAIVVTGRRRDDRATLTTGDEDEALYLPRAETGLIGKSRIGITVEQQALSGGAVSNRAMVTLKVPF